jgi:hypothetical protein
MTASSSRQLNWWQFYVGEISSGSRDLSGRPCRLSTLARFPCFGIIVRSIRKEVKTTSLDYCNLSRFPWRSSVIPLAFLELWTPQPAGAIPRWKTPLIHLPRLNQRYHAYLLLQALGSPERARMRLRMMKTKNSFTQAQIQARLSLATTMKGNWSYRSSCRTSRGQQNGGI